ncbi:MAG: hypothetical protein KatS3mg088_423 [Patescibacteria group bacterium]|nr:MAG: hypothetical protein KatS3mg088_423 [Patescibacteria group bacterium]
MKNKVLSIVIVNYNTCDLTLKCLYSILADKTIPPYEIILIDNASTDGSIDRFNRLNWKNLIILSNKENLGFSKAVNQGIKVAKGRYILLLNSDTEVPKGSIKKMLDFASKNPDAGVIAPKLVYGDGKIQPSAFHLPTVWGAIKEFWLGIGGSYGQYIPDSKVPIAVDAVVGACFLITPKALKKVGFFDERYFMYFEDLDYCRRVKKMGLKVYYLPNVRIVHLHGQSGKKLADERNQWKRLIPSSKIYHGVIKHFLISFIIWARNKLKMKIFKPRYFDVFVVVLFSILSGRYLLKSGYFPIHDDIQAFRLLEMDKCIKDWQIPCRWVPDMGYGYGYPQFNYYAPLPYYIMEFFHLLGFSFLDSTKIGFGLSTVVAGLGMYLLSKTFFGRWGGLLSALFYIWAPYRAVNMFVRGAMGELWGMAFLPFAFWSAKNIVIKKDKFSSLWLALSIFGIFTSHNVTALIFVPFFTIWVLFLSLSSQSKTFLSNVINLFLPSFLGLLMSSFFTLPAILEKKYAHIETMFMGYFNYLAHFVGLGQLLFSRKFGYGASVWGPDDEMLLSVGLLHWIVPTLVFILFIFSTKKVVKNSRSEIVLFFILGIISLFLIHPRSVFIWKIIPALSYLQFPWRFLSTASFFFSFVAGGLATILLSTSKKIFYTVLSLVSLLLISFNISYFKPEKILDITDRDKFTGQSWEKQLTISIFDYLPVSAKLPPNEKAPNEPRFLSGEGKVLDGKRGTNWQNWKIDVISDEAKVVFPIYNYPVWKAIVNGKQVKIFESGDLGLVTISVSKGELDVSLKLEDTLIRRLSNYISLLSFLLVLFLIFVNRYNLNKK